MAWPFVLLFVHRAAQEGRTIIFFPLTVVMRGIFGATLLILFGSRPDLECLVMLELMRTYTMWQSISLLQNLRHFGLVPK